MILARGLQKGKAWPSISKGIAVTGCHSWKLLKLCFYVLYKILKSLTDFTLNYKNVSTLNGKISWKFVWSQNIKGVAVFLTSASPFWKIVFHLASLNANGCKQRLGKLFKSRHYIAPFYAFFFLWLQLEGGPKKSVHILCFVSQNWSFL